MAAATRRMTTSDFESPGYEYLRSYQNMSNLYNKLVALNYQQDFCPTYKCPPIHRYYFTTSSNNLEEQQYIFTCLCAWLIKEKCQMNLDFDPEEYEDLEIIVGVISEALRLLLTSEDDMDTNMFKKKTFGFPLGRLKQGYGPEVIWALNILADRALELIMESEPSNKSGIKIVYNDKKGLDSGIKAGSGKNDYITIGQPFVGGGLTTRPLGSYQIDDVDLLFDTDTDPDNETCFGKKEHIRQATIDANEWYARVHRNEHLLRNRRSISATEAVKEESWRGYLDLLVKSRKEIEGFMTQSRPALEEVHMKIDRHMQAITDRERTLQSDHKTQIDEFLVIWRDYSSELRRYNELSEQVNAKTDEFESHNERLRLTNSKIETRIRELNDGNKLRELEMMIDRLDKESAELDVKIGLLLSIYPQINTSK